MDNVYSHRSTQKYKRKPFISHYWDCRLKGRPPGTPKSDDPNKKKRKRTARQRDLCEVKIKITEYLPGAVVENDFESSLQASPLVATNGNLYYGQANGTDLTSQDVQAFGMIGQNGGIGLNSLLPNTGKRYVIQRVNGNGGNGKGDGVGGPHRHTLEDSDKIKKNSVIRWAIKNEKEKKKTQVSNIAYASTFTLQIPG